MQKKINLDWSESFNGFKTNLHSVILSNITQTQSTWDVGSLEVEGPLWSCLLNTQSYAEFHKKL